VFATWQSAGVRVLDDLHLRAIWTFDKAHVPPVVGRQFLQNAHAVPAKLRQRARIIVGLHRHVLDAVVLLMALRGDEAGDLSCNPCRLRRYPRTGLSPASVAPKLSM
jgi:hypothetical protein